MKTVMKKLLIYFGFSGVLTLILYGKALTYPFFFDDAVHFRLLESYSLSKIWIAAEGFPYFRPFPFAVWKLITLLWGRYPPLILHGMLLLLHAINGGLIGWLLHRDVEEGHFRFLPFAGIALFIVFPFSYQAVVWVASLFHPLVVFLILITIVGWMIYRRGRRLGAVIALFAGFLAPFTHESGILVGPLLTTYLWFAERKIDRKTFYLWLSGLIFLFFWLLVPKTREGTGIQGITSILMNIIYFLQGLSFPLLQAVGFLGVDTGNWFYILAIELIGVIILGVFLWRGSQKRLAGRGISWFVLAAIPVVMLLPFSYVIDGPRLLYLASVGIAIVWGAIFAGNTCPSYRIKRFGVYGAFLLTILLSMRVVRQEIRFFDWGSDLIWSMVSAMNDTPDSGPVLFVNVPAWFSSHQYPFKVGHDGATIIANYAPLEDLLSLHGVPNRDVIAVTYPDILQKMDYDFGSYGPMVDQTQLGKSIESVDGVWRTVYTSNGPKLLWAGRVKPTPTTNREDLLALFENDWELLESERLKSEYRDRIVFKLLWRCGQPLSPNWTIFLHVYDANGQVLVQGDGDFLMNTYALSDCPAAAMVEDMRYIPISTSDFDTATHIGIGLYNRQTAERMNAYQADGAPWYNDAAIIWTSVETNTE